MAISKEKLREMRENSAAGAAKQRAKEQAELDKYMYRRNTEVANMLSTNEKIALVAQEKNKGLSYSQISIKHDIPLGSVNRYIAKAKELGLITVDGEDKPAAEYPSGVIDAAELTPDERAEITAQAERDAGIVPVSEANELDICDIAKAVIAAIRKAMDVPGFEIGLEVYESGAIQVTVVNKNDRANNVTLSGRK